MVIPLFGLPPRLAAIARTRGVQEKLFMLLFLMFELGFGAYALAFLEKILEKYKGESKILLNSASVWLLAAILNL